MYRMNTLSRRGFVSAAAVGASTLANFNGLAQSDGPLRVGVIGCGWFGNVLIKNAHDVGGVQVVAVCDVDSEQLDMTSENVERMFGSRPKMFKHYAELLDLPDLQAVFIATPPHWHALPFIAACEKGLSIYCEKPLAYDLREGRAMVNAHKKAGNIVQMGFQRRQVAPFHVVKQRLQDGAPGKVVQVDANIHYKAGVKDNTPQDPPKTLDWDLWCGPAPKLPLFCDNENIFVDDNKIEIIPNKKDAERQTIKPEQGSSGVAHMAEFLSSVQANKPAPCTPEIAFQSTGTVQLGMIAYETNNRVDWDAKAERITNSEAAQALLKREYRAPYKHPYMG